MRDEKARRCRFPGGQAQAARRRQLRLFDNAEDGGKALSPQALFDRIERIARTRRLDNDEPRWIKTETGNARRRWRAQFTRKLPRPAPKYPRPNPRASRGSGSICTLLHRERINSADRKTRRETDPGHPVRRRSTANGGRLAFDLMQ